MKLLKFENENTEERQKVIDSFKDAQGFVACTRKDGAYKLHCFGLSDEQLVYAAELLKINLFVYFKQIID